MNPLLLSTPLARANDLLSLYKNQVVIADSAWAKVVKELKEEIEFLEMNRRWQPFGVVFRKVEGGYCLDKEGISVTT